MAKGKGKRKSNGLNTVLVSAVKRIHKQHNEADRRKFMRALRYSIDGNGGSPQEVVMSPLQIEASTGISIREQLDYQVIVGRKQAVRFLKSLKYNLKEHSFRKKLGKDHWTSDELFPDRKVALVGNAYVFTYLEILRIESRTFNPDLDEYERFVRG